MSEKPKNDTFICENGNNFSRVETENWIRIFKHELLGRKLENSNVVLKVTDTFYSYSLFRALYQLGNSVCLVEDEKHIQNSKNEWAYMVLYKDERLDVKQLQTIEKSQKTERYLCLLTSGTTGQKKIIYHDFDKFLASYSKKIKGKKVLFYYPLNHVAGLDIVLKAWYCHNSLFIPKNIRIHDVVIEIEQQCIDVLVCTPTFLKGLLLSDINSISFNSLKQVVIGSEKLDSDIYDLFVAKYPNIDVKNIYGSTELGSNFTYSNTNSERFQFKNEKDYRIDKGLLLVKKPSSLVGYEIPGKAFISYGDDWFNTNDKVDYNKDGILVKERNERTINVAGQNLDLLQIEHFIEMLPEVKKCIAEGRKNIFTGNTLRIQVVLQANTTLNTIKNSIRAKCNHEFGSYAIPSEIDIVENT